MHQTCKGENIGVVLINRPSVLVYNQQFGKNSALSVVVSFYCLFFTRNKERFHLYSMAVFCSGYSFHIFSVVILKFCLSKRLAYIGYSCRFCFCCITEHPILKNSVVDRDRLLLSACRYIVFSLMDSYLYNFQIFQRFLFVYYSLLNKFLQSTKDKINFFSSKIMFFSFFFFSPLTAFRMLKKSLVLKR